MFFGCYFTRLKYMEVWEYMIERWARDHSSFDWEALEHRGDTLYLRKRRAYAWMKWYEKKKLPPSEWKD